MQPELKVLSARENSDRLGVSCRKTKCLFGRY
jgi:hypothetical protein